MPPIWPPSIPDSSSPTATSVDDASAWQIPKEMIGQPLDQRDLAGCNKPTRKKPADAPRKAGPGIVVAGARSSSQLQPRENIESGIDAGQAGCTQSR